MRYVTKFTTYLEIDHHFAAMPLPAGRSGGAGPYCRDGPGRAVKYMKYTLKYTEIQLGRVQSQIHQIYAPNTCMNTATLPIDRSEKKTEILQR